MKRLVLLTVLVGLLQPVDSIVGSEISNFFTPYGFRTPLLEQGQYTLSFNPHYYRHESQMDTPSGWVIHSESVSRQYSFSLNGLYALIDRLIVQGSVILYPGQMRSTYRDVWSTPYSDLTTEWKMREHSNFSISPGIGLSFRPETNIEFYGDFHFSKDKSFYETEDEERFMDLKGEEIYFNLGFTMLGRVPADKSTKPSDSRLFNFVRPYGFRAPVLSRGQYAVSLNSFYARIESFSDYVGGPEFEKSIWKRYYFSLNGLYALTERLLFQSSLDIYPAQTRETYDRVKVGTYLNYDEMCSDFAVFPGLVVSLRPKVNMEFYGVFLFTRENLHKRRESGFQSDVSQDYYYFDFGYTALLKSSLRGSRPIPESELSNFFTPSGFRTPLLIQDQGAMNVEFHYDRTESKEHHPRSLQAIDTRSTTKRYYFSLNGVYAVIDQLIIECGLDVLPGQTRVTTRYTWHTDVTNAPTGATEEQHSNFTVSPRLEVCFRPHTNTEFYGAFYFNKEKTSMEDRHYDLRNEYFYLDFGFTILGDL
jgi:hypothetical protein